VEIVPRDYQESFIHDIKAAIRAGDKRIIACASTGAGKSIVLAAIAQSALAKGKRVIIVLPRKSLVIQLSATFEQFKIRHTILMAGEPYHSQARCQIISIDTYTSRLAAKRMLFVDADVLCIDEMHVQHTDTKIKLFDRYKVIVAFTATPVAPKKRPLGVLYTKIVSSISMKELVSMGHLVPLRYFAPSDFHSDDVKVDAEGEYNSRQLDEYIDDKLKTEDGKLKIVGDVVENWQRIASDRQTVVFCKTQAHSRHIQQEFLDKGVKALYIDCNTDIPDREQIFRDMAEKRAQVLVNVGIVAMGIDIPILSCVILATPINRIARYLQCVGRLTRPHKESGKVDGLVIDHCGIVSKLGFADDEQFWTLDGEESPEELKKKDKEEKEAPKEITCSECSFIFVSRKSCPQCAFEMVPLGEEIPVHQAELVEISAKDKVPSPADKKVFYSMLLGHAKNKGFKTGWADHSFKTKFGHFPKTKKGVEAINPDDTVLGYIKHLQIRRARSRK